MIYLIILAVLGILSLRRECFRQESYIHQSLNKPDRLYWGICIFLSLFMGLRYRVGGDTLWYDNLFENMPSLSELSLFDFRLAYFYPGWYVLNAFAKSTADQFWVVQIIQAFFVNIVVFSSIKNLSDHKYTCLFIYYFFFFLYFNTEIMREAISCGFFMLSFESIKKQKWVRYYLFALAAFAFHPSAIFTLVFPVIYLLTPTRWQMVFAVGAFLFLFSFFISLPQLASMMPTDFIKGKAEYYFEQVSTTRTRIISIMKDFIPLAFCVWFLWKRTANNAYVRKMMVITLFLSIVSLFIGGAYRLSNYMVLFKIYMIAETLIYILNGLVVRKAIYPIALYAIAVLFFSQCYYYNRTLNKLKHGEVRYYQRWHPYSSIFNPEICDARERGYFKSMERD